MLVIRINMFKIKFTLKENIQDIYLMEKEMDKELQFIIIIMKKLVNMKVFGKMIKYMVMGS